MNSSFSNSISNSNFDYIIGGGGKDMAMMIGGGILILGIIAVVIYFSIQNTKNNGGSTTQAFVGKKTGSMCISNAMCSSNKCNKYNICVL